jgi:hypothetical protein
MIQTLFWLLCGVLIYRLFAPRIFDARVGRPRAAVSSTALLHAMRGRR